MSGTPKDSLSEFLRTNQTVMAPGSTSFGLTPARGPRAAPTTDLEKAIREVEALVAAQQGAVAAPPAAEPAADRVFAWLGENGPASPVAVLRALGLGPTEGAEAFALLENAGLVRRETVDGAVRLALAE